MSSLTIRRGGKAVVSNLSARIQTGDCWAILGPAGSGKTSFLQTLAGQLPAPPVQLSVRTRATLVSFREESQQFSYTRHFYQQRYQATLSDGQDGQPAMTLRDFLAPVWSDGATALLQRMGLAPLLDRVFLKLSNGQTRKARIARALLQQPQVLLLDNPFAGLDPHFRADLTAWLGELVAGGLTLLVVTDTGAPLPDFITHVLVLGEGTTAWAGSLADYVPAPRPAALPSPPVLQTPAQPIDFQDAFSLYHVTVQYDADKLLDDVSWTVKAGERWALLGHNGAGKSILLSLLYGDHPQAYANEIYLFDYRRGRSGESIWDVKRRIGFVSPELHLYFPGSLSVRDVALTGLTDTLVVPVRVSAEAGQDLAALLAYFGLTPLAQQLFSRVSTAEQRLVLLVRALLKNPAVLILDEPFQTLDERQVQLARQLLDTLSDKTIVFVSHHPAELPQQIDRVAQLSAGQLTIDANRLTTE